ncbi:uncharacterized protein LOC134251433 isoform X2 [Saccostrea cucullata]|uniref:uncharacterized protein LOC134251433 isoform X2 n=1 Tax=Saccostrea cuccullata TaxID=36930 RepID=UPI002ED33A1E
MIPDMWYRYSWYTLFCVFHLYIARSFGQDNFYPVTSCTDARLKDIPLELLQACAKKGFFIHCLAKVSDEMGLSCFDTIWIEKGKCPYYNSYQGNLDERDCIGSDCATMTYKSLLSVNYKGCYPKELASTVSITTVSKNTTTVMIQTTQQNATKDKMRSTTKEAESNRKEIIRCSEESFLSLAVVSITINILCFIVIIVALVKKTWYQRSRMNCKTLYFKVRGRPPKDIGQQEMKDQNGVADDNIDAETPLNQEDTCSGERKPVERNL